MAGLMENQDTTIREILQVCNFKQSHFFTLYALYLKRQFDLGANYTQIKGNFFLISMIVIIFLKKLTLLPEG